MIEMNFVAIIPITAKSMEQAKALLRTMTPSFGVAIIKKVEKK